MKTLTLIILSIILLSLKILGLIKLSIFFCLTPLWLPVALFVGFAVIVLPLFAIACMVAFSFVVLFTLPYVIIKELVRHYRLERHKHDYHSEPLGLDQCADPNCGSIRESK